MKTLGVPYSDEDVANAEASARAQAAQIADGLRADAGIEKLEERQVVALIAYLQKLGKTVDTTVSQGAGQGVDR